MYIDDIRCYFTYTTFFFLNWIQIRFAYFFTVALSPTYPIQGCSERQELLHTVRNQPMKPTNLSLHCTIIVLTNTFFLHRLMRFCRDGYSNEFAKEAWHYFYNIIKYHNGVVAYLETHKLTNQFMEAISPGVPYWVVSNALHFIAKVRVNVIFFLFYRSQTILMFTSNIYFFWIF